MILDEIIAKKRQRVNVLREKHSFTELERAASAASPPRDFFQALRNGGAPAVIAEIKKASPSAGVIRSELDVGALVSSYERGGAAALSVITEEDFFDGKLEYLREARDKTHLPVLCKDFIIDPVQVFAARDAHADALLLIACVLKQDSLVSLLKTAHALQMECLVEVHNEEELIRVLATDARIIGINNRDLLTFKVDLKTSLRLRPLIPTDRLVVSESGISKHADIKILRNAGVDAVLVGTTLMRATDPEQKLKQLRGTL
jgi:indole-3-glycerol phosphate synthase